MSYQETTGSLMANSHPGSYCGQDAYNNMLITERHEFFNSANRPIQGDGEIPYPGTERFQVSDRPDRARERERESSMSSEESKAKTIVRRLTPTECIRLQGFPDDWLDIDEWVDEKGRTRKTTDSAKYKAIGNSIALPYWEFLARKICSQYERPMTMGSLFDGVSGFPLAFKRAGAEPLWASEIEGFPIAVCKKHFGDEETGEKGDINEYL